MTISKVIYKIPLYIVTIGKVISKIPFYVVTIGKVISKIPFYIVTIGKVISRVPFYIVTTDKVISNSVAAKSAFPYRSRKIGTWRILVMVDEILILSGSPEA